MSRTRQNRPSSKLGFGCLALFALPFAVFGAFAMFQGIAKLLEREWGGGLGLLLFGAIFCAVAVGMIVMAVVSRRHVQRQHAREAAHPEMPWLWREEWAGGEIRAHSRRAMYFLIGFAAFWNAIALPATIAVFMQAHGKPAAWFVLIFPLAGLVLIALAGREVRRWQRFGESKLKLRTMPGVVGGLLEGVIELTRPVPDAAEVRVRLACIERDSRGDNTSENLLWEDEQVLAGDVLRMGSVPVRFQIPYEAAETSKHPGSVSTLWRVEVKAPLPGADFQAQFEVPVFKTAESRADFPALATGEESLPHAVELKPPQGVELRSGPGGVTEFVFAAGRNRAAAITVGLFTLAWTVTLVVIIRFKAPILFPIVFGFFELLLLYALLSTWTSASRLAVDERGIDCTSWFCGVRCARFLAANEVRSIETKLGMTSGSTTYYDLHAVHDAKKKTKIASGIRGKKESEWLAREILNALGRS